jgi:hypothetical protein
MSEPFNPEVAPVEPTPFPPAVPYVDPEAPVTVAEPDPVVVDAPVSEAAPEPSVEPEAQTEVFTPEIDDTPVSKLAPLVARVTEDHPSAVYDVHSFRN